MPSTYNGIGTHYYGQKNLTLRRGTCAHCNAVGDLKSYDTRLWFVIVFIPIIPLGRKRIIDYCPSCTRHHLMELDKWETAKQLEISGAQDDYRRNPTPEGAIAVHQQLLKFHQSEEAAQFQKEMAEKYQDHAKVQAYLGAALEFLGQPSTAAGYYAQALKLRPDLPEARIGVARNAIREGRLDEARKLLDFLEKSGAAQLYSLEPLETLAIAYQNAGNHQAALELLGRLQTELPNIDQVAAFRKLVKTSEKALARPGSTSMLPRQKFSWRSWLGGGHSGSAQPAWRALAWIGILGGLVALGFVIANEYIRRHRTLYIVNAFSNPANVAIQGGENYGHIRKLQPVNLAEGRYHATISGPVTQELDFEVRSSYFSRWFNDPIWVINIGGEAPLLFEHVTYGENAPPPQISLHFGNKFQLFPNVTHPFTELPETISMKRGQTRVLSHLDLFPGKPEAAFAYLRHEGQISQALAFAEHSLRGDRENKTLLLAYLSETAARQQGDRADRYLQAGLNHRPVAIEWHRQYQQLHQNSADRAKLTQSYDQMLRAEPTNSALLYLRGRIEPERAQARQFFERSVEVDPANAFASYALGFDRLTVADWPQARRLLARAVELAPDNEGFSYWHFVARLGCGEVAALQQELQQQLQRDPLDFHSERKLLFCLALQGQREAALAEQTAFEKRWINRHGPRSRPTIEYLRRLTLYAVGDFAELEKWTKSDTSAAGRLAYGQALIEQGRVKEVLALRGLEGNEENEFWLLAVAVALHDAGDKAGAADWLQKAVAAMKEGQEELEQVAGLLSGSTLPSRSELENVALPPNNKALVLVALGQRHPEAAGALAGEAKRFNVDPRFPHHLVQHVAGQPRTPTAP